ncbi:MAG: PAS domain-containing sensor histidine kinase [Pseudobdellovibrionaceae bacterium]
MKTGITSQLRLVLDDLPVAVYIKDVRDDYRFVLWNKQAQETWNLTEKQVVGKTDFQLFSSEVARFFREKDIETIQQNKLVYVPEENFKSLDGEIRWFRTWRHLISDENGQPSLLVGVSQDITSIKMAIDESHRQRQQLQSISDNAPGVLFQFRVTPENHMSFTYISRKSKDIFGIDPEEIMGRAENMFELLHPDDRAGFFNILDETIRNRKSWKWQGRVIDSQGQTLYIEAHSNPYVGDNGCTYWDGMFQDLSKLKEHEKLFREQSEKMHQAARLVSLGEMAGGVAHEINTPLGAIGILSEVAIREIEKKGANKPKVIAQLNQINDMVFRISKIVKAMRSYARKDSDDRHERTSFHSIVDEVLSVCSHRLKQEQIKFDSCKLPKDLYLDCHSIQISQILMNLINNSCDAIKDLDEKWIQIQIHSSTDQSLEISFSDSGTGIPPDVAEKLFESFFTTKGPKEGTGLGLSMSKNMMKSHGGDLILNSNSKNTCFILKFPRTKVEAA